jgi:Bacterial SH3 domain
MAQSTLKTRLCPHCANSIALDALTCPYCKADLLSTLAPQWPSRSEEEELPLAAPSAKQKLPLRSKIILVLGLLLFALGVYMVGGNRERNDFTEALQNKDEDLRDKDDQIKNLEAELAQLRQQSQRAADQVAELKSKLSTNEKDLTSAQSRLREANREIDRLSSSRLAAVRQARSAEPPPQTATNSNARSSRGAEPGLYEITRATSVYEEPAASSRVMSQIGKGTQITVVRSTGDWLEIRSKHGNPSGYIRSDDAASLGRSN